MFFVSRSEGDVKYCTGYRTEVKETTDAKPEKKGIIASLQLWVCIVAVAVIFVTGCGTSTQEENTLAPADDTAEEITAGEEASAEEADTGEDTAQEDISGEETDSSEAVSDSETTDEETPDEADATGEMTAIADADVGDIITFGSYEQDNDLENGTEPVEWYVLDKADGEATLLSVYLLDCQPYHEDYVDITWENCTLRSWLNGAFYNAAFSAEEQAAIVNASIANEDNPYFGTEGGNDTADKVWLLSLGEVERYFNIDTNVHYNGNMDSDEYAVYCYGQDHRVCAKPTEYATARGVYPFSEEDAQYYDNDMSYAIGSGWWWLRSPGGGSYRAASVGFDGGVDIDGLSVDDYSDGVRPALKVAY